MAFSKPQTLLDPLLIVLLAYSQYLSVVGNSAHQTQSTMDTMMKQTPFEAQKPRPQVALTPVTSAKLFAVGYDAASNTLAVQFKKGDGTAGTVYHYANVTTEDYATFRDAESLGSHFHRVIKADPVKFPYTKIEEKKPEQDGGEE